MQEIFIWWEEQRYLMVELKCATTMLGEQCVMMPGITLMQELYADS